MTNNRTGSFEEQRPGGNGREGNQPHQGRSSEQGSYAERLLEQDVVVAGAEVVEGVVQLGRSARRFSHLVTSTLSEAVRAKPEAVLGGAAGVGFVLGGGMRSQAGRIARAMATRMALSWVTGKVVEEVREPEEGQMRRH